MTSRKCSLPRKLTNDLPKLGQKQDSPSGGQISPSANRTEGEKQLEQMGQMGRQSKFEGLPRAQNHK
ncbi:unnamed protein product [Dovyalis caffra]|uniref:Uncharacterized protein n=1 Tax=Dovyalis caffra TaxID=77055 RepID=A0AAV1SCT5_9ROSI|nr:unnamed protein product [Dovyalis caffra]